MSALSVIIPSKTASNLKPCVEAVRCCQPDARLIVVDDCIHALKADGGNEILDLCEQFDITWLIGVAPFVFARNCNLGIQAAGTDDVVLLNDDAILETPHGFRAMQRSAEEHPEVGLVSATTNVAGNPAQIHQGGRHSMRIAGNCPGNSFPTVAYVCVFIPRRTINLVGLLDERFGGTTPAGKRIYGYEDNDYSRRVHLVGLKLGIHDGCYVDHGCLRPTFRGDPTSIDMQAAREIYLAKWGSA